MHICFVCREYPPSLRGGGIASYIKEVAHGLHDAGHRVTVIAASDDTRLSSDEDDEGVRVIRLLGGDFLIPQVEGNSLLKKFRMFYRFYAYRKRIRENILASLCSLTLERLLLVTDVPNPSLLNLVLCALSVAIKSRRLSRWVN